MVGFSLEDIDKHIDHLGAQLQFLKQGLDATDHNAPEWLGKDLLSLRNQSGKLRDDMKRFRDQLQSEGLAVKKVKTANKRLSIEGARPSTTTPTTTTKPSDPPDNAVSPPLNQTPTPRARPSQPYNDYAGEHVDVTEEVNRRLQESRLRRLMETPGTAQKRKRDAFQDPASESATEAEDDGSGYGGGEQNGTPTKRLKSTGTFEQVHKRKENGNPPSGGQPVDQGPFKRRKL